MGCGNVLVVRKLFSNGRGLSLHIKFWEAKATFRYVDHNLTLTSWGRAIQTSQEGLHHGTILFPAESKKNKVTHNSSTGI